MEDRDNPKTPKGELRQRAELLVSSKTKMPPVNLEELSLDEIHDVLHELNVHQIELEMQNEELQRVQGVLEVSRERFFDLYDMAPVGYCTVNKQDIVIEANLTSSKLLGVGRKGLVGKPISRYIFTEDHPLYYHQNKEVFKTGEPKSYEIRLVKQDGTQFWGRIEAALDRLDQSTSTCRLVLIDISAQKQAEKAVQKQLIEKETLLKEVHHRIKNNIISIKNFLFLRTQSVHDPTALSILYDSISRVQSMSALYETLLQTTDYKNPPVRPYIEDLVQAILDILPEKEKIIVKTQLDDFLISEKMLFPLGMIVNELVTNSIKFGMTNKETCKLEVILKKEGSKVTLTVKDDGPGLSKDFIESESKGFGLTIVNMLAEQLQGSFVLENKNGVRGVFEFDLNS